jgi:hypothetical protein
MVTLHYALGVYCSALVFFIDPTLEHHGALGTVRAAHSDNGNDGSALTPGEARLAHGDRVVVELPRLVQRERLELHTGDGLAGAGPRRGPQG